MKEHPDGTGTLEVGLSGHRSRGWLSTKIHLVAASLTQVIGLNLTPGHAHDAPPGRELLKSPWRLQSPDPVDRGPGLRGNEKRAPAQSLGFEPVVPPKLSRVDLWEYDTDHYNRRNEIERFFGCIKR